VLAEMHRMKEGAKPAVIVGEDWQGGLVYQGLTGE